MKFYYALLLLTLLASCSRVFYNVQEVTKMGCATKEDVLTIKIRNSGSIGISNLQLEIEGTYVSIGGVEPGQTTCAYAIRPIYSHPGYKLYVLKSDGTSWLIEKLPIDHTGDELITKGELVLTIKLTGKSTKFSVNDFTLKRS